LKELELEEQEESEGGNCRRRRKLLEEVNVAPATHNVRNKHTVATEEIVLSLMILLKL
jgi:hypothetical protein